MNTRRQIPKRADRDAVIAAAQGRCRYCGITGASLEVHHIVPKALGGSSEPNNLEAVCASCNRAISMAPREGEFVAFLAGLLKESPKFRAVEQEPVIGPERLRPDLLVTEILDSTVDRPLLIECKSVSVLSSVRRQEIDRQFRRYRLALPDHQLVLAIPGNVPEDVAEALTKEGVTIWDLDRIEKLFHDEIASSDNDYYPALLRRASAPKRPESQLIADLKACPSGLAGWSTYQKIVGRALEMLFCPPLNKPFGENADFEKVNRRDFIFPNYASEGFWLTLRQRYGADYILVDAKNARGKVTKSAVLQIANYLKPHGVGLFAIILGRNGPDRGAAITIREQWLMHSKLIVILNDADLEAMLLARLAEGDPANIVSERIQQFRLLI